jgi:UDP-N-acetyl-2-amino-2-deoxyglucuronate dehydrogenase
MNYAIIGKGFIYPRHVQAIEATGGKVLMTCDTRFNETNPDFTDWLEMYNHPKFKEVDTVVICTPNYLHSTMAREAILKGKKVICEKPLSINGTDGLEGVVPVLQLRYHPQLQNIKNIATLHVTAKMFRDEVYWNSWKGNPVKSGGILYNLGIHYLDLIVWLLGTDYTLSKVAVTDKTVTGVLTYKESVASFWIEILDSREGQVREITYSQKGGSFQTINLSNKDNLSYEDMHLEVYKHFIKGEGVPLSEAKKSLELVNKLLQFSGNN